MRSNTDSPYACGGGFHAGVQPALYAVCGSYRRDQTGTGRQMGFLRGALAVFHCLDHGIHCPPYRFVILISAGRELSDEYLGCSHYSADSGGCFSGSPHPQEREKEGLFRLLQRLSASL